jgi:hypothetical protein
MKAAMACEEEKRARAREGYRVRWGAMVAEQ